MLQDRFRRKTAKPSGNGNSPLETVDISEKVPDVDDVLAEIDNAINKAQELEEQVRPQDTCSC